MPRGIQSPMVIDLPVSGGLNTVSQPTALQPFQARYLLNGYQPSRVGPCAKRPGSIPVTNAALGSPIQWLCLYRTGSQDRVLAAAGTSLYKYSVGTFTALTGAITSANLWETDFTDANSNSRKIITDTGGIKAYNDIAGAVSQITPATDDPSPNPPNILSTLHTKGMKYCFSYKGHVFLSDGSDTWWYSKRYTYDYYPSVQWERWVRQNDYMMGPGWAFDNVCLLPMRRGWGMLFGDSFDNFDGNQYLNTNVGVIAPRSPQRLTYPNGMQTIAFVSDDGVYEIYDNGVYDSGSRRYSTRIISTSPDKGGLDFNALGLTDAEKAGAVGYFDQTMNLYLLRFSKGSERMVYAYDVRNGEWYPWSNIKAAGFVRTSGALYYAGETGHLHKFDESLGSDWNDAAKTSGTPIDFDRITDMIKLEDTGFPSMIDEVIVNARQYAAKSSLDVYVIVYSNVSQINNAVNNQFMVWNVSAWNQAAWANLNYTDLVSNPKRLILNKLTYYVQIRTRNNRDEVCELYGIKLKGRASGM